MGANHPDEEEAAGFIEQRETWEPSLGAKGVGCDRPVERDVSRPVFVAVM
jgi:hypothetical protein